MVDGAALEKRCAKAPWVRIPPSPPSLPSWIGPSPRWRLRSLAYAPSRCARSSADAALAGLAHDGSGLASGRGRLVDYGAALEMRFGETRRGFESRPLRHLRPCRGSGHPGVGACAPRSSTVGCAGSGARRRLGLASPAARAGERHHSNGSSSSAPASPPGRPGAGIANDCRGGAIAVDSPGRARRGTSGALYLQSAPAGLNPLPRSPFSNAAASSDVEGRVPRSGDSRTVSGPEGSSTQRSSSGAAERPGPSRSRRWARGRDDRRRVHGIFIRPCPPAGVS